MPAAVLVALSLAALLGRVGADARWLAALGHAIVSRGSIPRGVPFAAAPSGHWANPLVLAELLFYGLERAFGDSGLMIVQLVAVAGALTLLARDALARGASSEGAAFALLIAAAGALPALAIARVQLFSLVLFAALLVLLRSQTRRPSAAVWLVVPLLALWANLHGGVLLGLAVTLIYLLLERGRMNPRLAAALALSSVLALCMTPALLHSLSYYHGLLTNVAAQRGEGMWSPLSLRAPLDLPMLACMGALAVRALRHRGSRLGLWETAVLVILAALTVSASRNGVWVLFFMLAPAAAGEKSVAPRRLHSITALRVLAPIAAAAILFGLVRGPASSGASPALVRQAIQRAGGTPVLAANGIEEQVALAGGRIWIGDPIDAFTAPDQAAYLDWVQGTASGARELGAQIRVVLVTRGSASQRLMARLDTFSAVASEGDAVLYERLHAPS